MQIGTLHIKGKTFLAPLAGITNLPFRLLVKEFGCAVVCSEMISAKGIFYNSGKTLAMMASRPEEKPLSVQLFGADPDTMARAAAFVQDLDVADIIDINFGCSVKKVIKQGAGVALMGEPERAKKILTAVRKATDLPLTIKIRTGWEAGGRQAHTISRIAQDTGVDAVIVHPRTASQMFRGASDWDLIRQIKKSISLPVIGNGDINNVEDAQKMVDRTGCDGVMVGRAALKNPFLLSQIEMFFSQGTHTPVLPQDIFGAMKKLTTMYVAHFGESTACRMLRGRLSWFVKGFPGCSSFRRRLGQIQTENQALEMIQDFESQVL